MRFDEAEGALWLGLRQFGKDEGERGKYENGEGWEEIWGFHFLHAMILLCSVAVKLAVCGFGREAPWWLIP